jgi:hypothetical protein
MRTNAEVGEKLCTGNVGLGRFSDDLVILRRAVAYLEGSGSH